MFDFEDFKQKRLLITYDIVPAFLKYGLKKQAFNIIRCGEFKHYSLCATCKTHYFNGFDSCKDRYCPICQKKRSLLYFARIVPVLKDLLQKGNYIQMLNFTITDSTDLEKSIQVLNDSFRYLSHQNRFMKKVFNSIFIGGIRSLEVKVGENSKKWHPHLHCIVIKDKYSKDFEFLRDSWNMAVKKCGGIESSLDGKYGSVFVSSIVDKKNPKNSNEYSVESGVLETLKYITKFDYSSYGDMLPELVRALKGVRSINTWGCLRNINLDVEEDMDKTYSEVYKVACSVCGSTDFINFTSRSLLANTKCFDYSDAVLETQDKLLPGKVELRDGLQVGKLYGGVMFTQLHATLAGKQFEVYKHKNKYKTFVVQQVEHIKEEKVYIPNSGQAYVKGSNTQTFKDRITMPEAKELIFSEEMLVHYFK